NVAGQEVVGHLGLEAELVARIGDECAAIGSNQSVEDRIGAARRRGFRIRIVAHKGRVVVADDFLLVAVQVLDVGVADEAALPRYHVLRQAGQRRDARIKFLRRVALQRRAGERGEIIRQGEMLGLGQRFSGEGAFALELGRGKRRQLQRGAERKAGAAELKGAFEHRRYHQDAVDRYALRVWQRTRHLGGAEAAVAFTKNEFR